MITKLRKFLEFAPQSGEWSVEDIKAHSSDGKFWSDKAIHHLLQEHDRTREVIDAMVECVEGFVLLAKFYHQENCAGDIHSPICENCSEGIARLQERLEKVK